MKSLTLLLILACLSSSAFAKPGQFSRCDVYTKKNGPSEKVRSLDMVAGGLVQTIDPDEQIIFNLYVYDVGNNVTEAEARISAPCTQREIDIAKGMGVGCAGHTLAQSIIEFTGGAPTKINVGGENYIVQCTADVK